MKSKKLKSQILLSLILYMIVPGEIGIASIPENEYEINDNKLIVNSTSGVNKNDSLITSDTTFKDKFSSSKTYELSDFKTIEINFSPTNSTSSALGRFSTRFDLANTDIIVTIKDTKKTNNDGVHLTNWNPHFVVNNYTAYIYAKKSDALNISHDATASYAKINNLKTVVANGSGIRANASRYGGTEQNNHEIAAITINESADITVTGDSGISGNTITAVYAGADNKYFKLFNKFYGAETKGQGIIYLNGTTVINTTGYKNYGVWSGKNGYIEVNKNLDIQSSGKNSYGVAATNGNVTYAANSDLSPNRYGSEVLLNGDLNRIYMQGENSKAIYAESEYAKIHSDNGKAIGLDVIGDIAAEDSGTITLASTIGSKVIGNLFANKKGIIDLNFNKTHLKGAANVDNATLNLDLHNNSLWEMTNTSQLTNLKLYNNSKLDMTADQHNFSTLTVDNLKGTTSSISGNINMDIDSSQKNISDRIYINGIHEGIHAITLNPTVSATDGADGTVLVSVKDEQGKFIANDTEGSLYWNRYELDKQQDTITNNTDWYLKEVSKLDPTINPTASVDTVLSVNSLNYHTWRTENDKLMKRMGELRHNGDEEKGAWFRVKGSKIGRDGSFNFTNKYTTYELGYDEVAKRTDDMVRYQGAALSYTDGNNTYSRGSGENHGKSISFYNTDQYAKGHYLDVVFKINNLDNNFKVFDTAGNKITGEYDNTGVSISAEYGRKNDLKHGWYIEPQAQLTLGYMGGASYETSNGISVDQSGIKSAVGRVGFNVGKKVGQRGIIYAKANLLHEFGGGYDVAMTDGKDSLTYTDTFNDTWFEYGVGAAFATSKNSHLYFDVERSAGSEFYKDWQWNAGVRWSF